MKSIAIIGGDARQVSAAARLAADGYAVRTFKTVQPCRLAVDCPTLGGALVGAEAVVLPIPVSRDGVHLFSTTHTEMPTTDEMMACFKSPVTLFGGNINSRMVAQARAAAHEVVDYLSLEAFNAENAALTAEAALGILLRESTAALRGLPVAVIGYGRIGKYLTRLLLAMGAQLTVYARGEADLALARLFGARALSTDSLAEGSLRQSSLVVNTVPAKLLTPHTLAHLPPDSLILELASGTENIRLPENSTARLMLAHGLPGKVFPVSAGHLIAEVTDHILRRETA